MPANSENIEELREENRALRRSRSDRTNEPDRQTAELQKLRNEAFLHPVGDAALDTELLRILQIRPIHSHVLVEMLKIGPTGSLGHDLGHGDKGRAP
jgi:hypothetical protein